MSCHEEVQRRQKVAFLTAPKCDWPGWLCFLLLLRLYFQIYLLCTTFLKSSVHWSLWGGRNKKSNTGRRSWVLDVFNMVQRQLFLHQPLQSFSSNLQGTPGSLGQIKIGSRFHHRQTASEFRTGTNRDHILSGVSVRLFWLHLPTWITPNESDLTRLKSTKHFSKLLLIWLFLLLFLVLLTHLITERTMWASTWRNGW